MNIINKIKKVQNVSQSFSAFIFIDNQNHRSIIRADDQAHTLGIRIRKSKMDLNIVALSII